jgi:predicted Zn-dependent protease
VYTLNLAFSDRKLVPVDVLKAQGKSMDFEDFGYGLNGGDTFAKARERSMLFLAIALREPGALATFAARGPQEAEARFQEEAARYLQMSPKPELPEEARRFKVQAEVAVRESRFGDAAALYAKALDVAPWWPGGRFNRAVLLGELKSYGPAVREMKRYLSLAPDAPDTRAARDKIYEWEARR